MKKVLIIVMTLLLIAVPALADQTFDDGKYTFVLPDDFVIATEMDDITIWNSSSLAGRFNYCVFPAEGSEKTIEKHGLGLYMAACAAVFNVDIADGDWNDTEIDGVPAVIWYGKHLMSDNKKHESYGLAFWRDDHNVFLFGTLTGGKYILDFWSEIDDIISTFHISASEGDISEIPANEPAAILDISGLTYDELLILKEQVEAAIAAYENK